MLDKGTFAKLRNDFVESQEFIEFAHQRRRDINFVCHHNAYLVAGFLQRRGHADVRWITGYYKCSSPGKIIHHSWLAVTVIGRTAVIFEFDPRQLHDTAGYDDDPMPSGLVPELSITISPIATIIDPDLIDLTDELRESRFVVSSKDVLRRYVADPTHPPNIDTNDLDRLGLESQGDFDFA
jgi:hypothetical protein